LVEPLQELDMSILASVGIWVAVSCVVTPLVGWLLSALAGKGALVPQGPASERLSTCLSATAGQRLEQNARSDVGNPTR
jgi:hypothetical protein